MDLLLRCNQRLVSSGLDEALVLQQTRCKLSRRRWWRPESKRFLQNGNTVGKNAGAGRQGVRLREDRGPRQFHVQPRFQNAARRAGAKGYDRFVIDLSECALMDSTFLGVLAGFGLKMNQRPTPDNAALNC